MSEDNCIKAIMECKDSKRGAKLVFRLKNYCADYVTQEQVVEIKNLLEDREENHCEETEFNHNILGQPMGGELTLLYNIFLGTPPQIHENR